MMYEHSGLQANSLSKLVLGSVNVCTAVAHTRDYCSLVDRRWRDFIHWSRAASV
jgi:hypothetical protein